MSLLAKKANDSNWVSNEDVEHLKRKKKKHAAKIAKRFFKAKQGKDLRS